MLQECFYHSDFVYVNIHLYTYNFCVINSNTFNNNNSVSRKQSQSFYPKTLRKYMTLKVVKQINPIGTMKHLQNLIATYVLRNV